jgi:hypothetical protein
MLIERLFIGGSLNGQFIPLDEEKIVIEQTDFDNIERWLLLPFDYPYPAKIFVLSSISMEEFMERIAIKYHCPSVNNKFTKIPAKTYHENPNNEDF